MFKPMRTIALVIIVGALGLIVGWFGGYFYYQLTKPSYGQFGYEFDGMAQAAIGALIGLVVSLSIIYKLFDRLDKK